MADPSLSEQSLFLAAVEKPSGAERAAYLDEACAGRPELRADVEALLAAHERLPVGSRTTQDKLTFDGPLTACGTVIGQYKILESIGEGGFGVVYMAEQIRPVQRRVALKIIKPGMDTKQVIARFEAERQALALMDHPNIAKVFDAGVTDAGRPYFVMELVKGLPITKYCDEHRLPPRQRLELFIQVCEAVQHAHQKAIIHRDLKPRNVLIALYDGKPVPKVIDFGVAKAIGQRLTDATLFTGFGDVVGTPQYMSPEQAELNQLDVDTRSDIYSLGVLLYELLTGTTPLEAKRVREAALLEVLRMIREEDPPRPSTRLTATSELPSIAAQRGLEPKALSGIVKVELDLIVMKALEKDRRRRYETANGLAGDIERYLRDEPVQACPPSAAYRLRKFARRNRAALVTASAVTLAVLLVVGSLGWMLRDRAARDEEIRRDQAKQRLRIEESAARALDVSDEYLQQGNWQQSLVEARRAESVLGSGLAGNDLRRRLAERLADLQFVLRLEEVRIAVPENPVAWNAAVADETYVRLFRDYGMDVQKSNTATVGKQMRERAIHVQLALALDSWSLKSDSAGRKRLLAIARVADPDEVRCRVRDALEGLDRGRLLELAKAPETARHSAATVAVLTSGLMAVKETDSAADLLRRAQNHHRDDFRINFLLANTYLFNQNPPRSDDAIRFYQAAVALRPNSGGLLNNLAMALKEKGQLDEAVEAYRESIRLQPHWAPAHSNLADALLAQGKLDEALVAVLDALELGDNGMLPAAVAAFRKAVEQFPKDAAAHSNLGTALHAEGKADEAVACFRKAFELNPEYAHVYSNLADALGNKGKLGPAIHEYREALRLKTDATDAAHHLASALNKQAWSLATDPEPEKRDPARAIALAKKAIELAPTAAESWNTLGVAHSRAGEWKEAQISLKKFRELRAGDAEWTNPFFLAMAHRQLGNIDEAVQWYSRAVDWMERNNAASEMMLRIWAEAAVSLHEQWNKSGEAERHPKLVNSTEAAA